MIKQHIGPSGQPYYSVADDITVWIAEGGGSIHIKTRDAHGDPVELAEHEAVELIELLTRLVRDAETCLKR